MKHSQLSSCMYTATLQRQAICCCLSIQCIAPASDLVFLVVLQACHSCKGLACARAQAAQELTDKAAHSAAQHSREQQSRVHHNTAQAAGWKQRFAILTHASSKAAAAAAEGRPLHGPVREGAASHSPQCDVHFIQHRLCRLLHHTLRQPATRADLCQGHRLPGPLGLAWPSTPTTAAPGATAAAASCSCWGHRSSQEPFAGWWSGWNGSCGWAQHAAVGSC
jgi:hypothetical protein